jgi:hypothetical protein
MVVQIVIKCRAWNLYPNGTTFPIATGHQFLAIVPSPQEHSRQVMLKRRAGLKVKLLLAALRLNIFTRRLENVYCSMQHGPCIAMVRQCSLFSWLNSWRPRLSIYHSAQRHNPCNAARLTSLLFLVSINKCYTRCSLASVG